jgi:Ca2+-binding EF-hand superfamily protein
MRATVVLVASLLFAASAAQAQSRAEIGARARAQFASADRNRDGALTRGEVTEALVRRFGRQGMTTGRSRILTNQYFGRLDANRDGRATRAEMNRAMEEGFRRFDTNRNGRIDPRERAAARAYLGNPAR